MKKAVFVILLGIFLGGSAAAQSPMNKDFGFGIIIGDPTGGTVKFWTTRDNAFAASIGTSYFGRPRIGVDYLWHFNAFNSNIAFLYAGPGGVIGVGEEGDGFWHKGKFIRTDNEVGLAARGIFGVNVIPLRTPLEIFLELGVLLALVPDFGSAADVALGIRFYP